MFKKMGAIWPSLFVVLLIAGCNTMQGFGEDMQKVGGAIQRGASK